jgi:ketosteroid isomerase-like protein
MAHPNEDTLRRTYEAFARGDLETVMSVFDEDIVWHSGGRNPAYNGDYKGHKQVQELFGRIFELSGGTYRIEIHDILANDEHAVALVRAKADRAGKSLDEQSCHVWHMKNGKATEFRFQCSDQYQSDEFWA